MIKPDVEGLHASGELIPENLKGEVKPVKLTYLFDVKEVFDLGVCYDAINQEYFINGAQVTRRALEKLVDKDYPNVDLDEMLERLKNVAICEHYN
jgi:hypothetical protein